MNLSELSLAEQHLTDYLDTCRWVEENNKPLNMKSFYTSEPECGTVCCMAGWMVFRSNVKGHDIPDSANTLSDQITETLRCALFPRSGAEKSFRYWVPLFGAHNGSGPETLARQRRRAQWFLNRIISQFAYHSVSQLTRQQRRLAQLHEQAHYGNQAAITTLYAEY